MENLILATWLFVFGAAPFLIFAFLYLWIPEKLGGISHAENERLMEIYRDLKERGEIPPK